MNHYFIFGTGGTTTLLHYRSLLAVAALGLVVGVLYRWSQIPEYYQQLHHLQHGCLDH